VTILSKPSARFAYEWIGFHSDGRSETFYRVIGGPSDGSDVTAETLIELGIDVPTRAEPMGSSPLLLTAASNRR
jgi:hypothetical protein